jgi:membrane dipeptidase
MFLVDAHLDLAYNALRGRQVLLPARQQTPDNEGIPSVGLPDLRAGQVGLVCATIFCAPDAPNDPGYKNTDEAHDMASRQIDWYRRQFDDGQLAAVKSRADLPSGAEASEKIAAILLLEGADPIRTPGEVAWYFDVGIRIVGLAWRQTRYAGGTGAPGPLTADGIRLVRELDRYGIIHDASHLAEASFWQLLDLSPGKIIASHSNCRSIVPTDRQLSDDMIRAITGRGGVIGINFYDRFLISPPQYGKRRATLDDVVTQMRHMCDVIGDDRHIGIGTDMDGGLGREQIPLEIETSADLPRLADALCAGGFNDAAVMNFTGENWRRFFAQALS